MTGTLWLNISPERAFSRSAEEGRVGIREKAHKRSRWWRCCGPDRLRNYHSCCSAEDAALHTMTSITARRRAGRTASTHCRKRYLQTELDDQIKPHNTISHKWRLVSSMFLGICNNFNQTARLFQAQINLALVNWVWKTLLPRTPLLQAWNWWFISSFHASPEQTRLKFHLHQRLYLDQSEPVEKITSPQPDLSPLTENYFYNLHTQVKRNPRGRVY